MALKAELIVGATGGKYTAVPRISDVYQQRRQRGQMLAREIIARAKKP